MAKLGKSAALRLLQTLIYIVLFCSATIILGIYAYFIAVVADPYPVPDQWSAVVGISGAAIIYLAFAVLLTCFFGGISFFAYTAVVLNILFCGAFIAIAVLLRDGADGCEGTVETPMGAGNVASRAGTYGVDLGLACNLNQTAFAFAIIGAILFSVAAPLQLWISRRHKKNEHYGGRRFGQRKSDGTHTTGDPEAANGVGSHGRY